MENEIEMKMKKFFLNSTNFIYIYIYTSVCLIYLIRLSSETSGFVV